MFRSTTCPLSREATVYAHLVLVILCGWLSGMQFSGIPPCIPDTKPEKKPRKGKTVHGTARRYNISYTAVTGNCFFIYRQVRVYYASYVTSGILSTTKWWHSWGVATEYGYVMLCYVMLCYVMLCYVMLCYLGCLYGTFCCTSMWICRLILRVHDFANLEFLQDIYETIFAKNMHFFHYKVYGQNIGRNM